MWTPRVCVQVMYMHFLYDHASLVYSSTSNQHIKCRKMNTRFKQSVDTICTVAKYFVFPIEQNMEPVWWGSSSLVECAKKKMGRTVQQRLWWTVSWQKSKATLRVLFCTGLGRATQSRCSFEFEMCQCMHVSQEIPRVCVSASLYVWVSKRLQVLADFSWGDSSHWSANLGSRVVMGLDIVDPNGVFEGTGFRLALARLEKRSLM